MSADNHDDQRSHSVAGDERDAAGQATAQDDWQRALWRSRRGMLELDLLLVEFAQQRYRQLPQAERSAYQALLDLDDWVIWDALQRRAPPSPTLAAVLDRIVAFIEENAQGKEQRKK